MFLKIFIYLMYTSFAIVVNNICLENLISYYYIIR